MVSLLNYFPPISSVHMRENTNNRIREHPANNRTRRRLEEGVLSQLWKERPIFYISVEDQLS